MNTFLKIIKPIIVLIIFYYLYQKNYFDLSFFAYFAKIETVIIIIFFSFFTVILNSIRWWLILKSQSIEISLFKTFKLVYMSSFFNNILPGSYGGDLFRIYYITKFSPDKKLRTSLTILLDRVYGLLGLILLGSFVFIFIFVNTKLFNIFIYLCFLIISIFFIIYSLLYFNKFVKKNFLNLINYFGINFKNFISCIVLSIILFFFVHTSVYLISTNIFNIEMKLLVAFFSNTISTLAAVVPITPGGLGISELVFVKVNEEIFNIYFKNLANIIIFFRLCNIIASFPSLIFYLMYKQEK